MLSDNSTKKKGRIVLPVLTVVLVLLFSLVLGTAAFLSDRTDRVENIFQPAGISCQVVEEFDGEIKRNVNVKNTSDTAVYVRINIISYRTNDNGQIIGGVSELPEFTPGDGWLFMNGFYYYSMPVLPDSEPSSPLIGDEGIKLIKYTDADGGKQTVEVMAEVIQAEPIKALQDAWGVTVSADGRISG